MCFTLPQIVGCICMNLNPLWAARADRSITRLQVAVHTAAPTSNIRHPITTLRAGGDSTPERNTFEPAPWAGSRGCHAAHSLDARCLCPVLACQPVAGRLRFGPAQARQTPTATPPAPGLRPG